MKHCESLEKISTPWLTFRQLAQYLNVTVGTVRNWVSQKYIPFSKRGGVVRFHRDKIDAWLNTGQCKGKLQVEPKHQTENEEGVPDDTEQ